MNAVDIESWVLMRSARAVATSSSKLSGSSSCVSALMMSDNQVVLHFGQLVCRSHHVFTGVRETELGQVGTAPLLDGAHVEIVDLQLLHAERDRHREC